MSSEGAGLDEVKQQLRYVVSEDCGRMLNPMVVEGQTYGGVAQGIGTAFYGLFQIVFG